MAYCTRKISVRDAKFLLTGKATGKNVAGAENVFNRDQSNSFDFQKCMVTHTLYVMKRKLQAFIPVFNTNDYFLFVRKSYLDYVLAKRGAVCRGTKSTVVTILL